MIILFTQVVTDIICSQNLCVKLQKKRSFDKTFGAHCVTHISFPSGAEFYLRPRPDAAGPGGR